MTPFGLPPGIVLSLLFAIGALLGRWINVCVERIPYRERLYDQWRVCSDRIAREDVVRAGLPIVGPMTAAGGRVFGSRPRGVRAGFVELLNGALLVLLYWCEVPTGSAGFETSTVVVPPPYDVHLLPGAGWSAVTLLHLRFAAHAVLVQALLAATLVDMELKIIPSSTTDPFTLLGVVLSFAIGGLPLLPVWFSDPHIVQAFLGGEAAWPPGEVVPAWIALHPHWHGLAASVAGLVVGGGVVLLLRIVGGWALGREAMGQGDVYLMMTIGAFLGWQAALVVFFLAPLAALAIHAVRWMTVSEGEIPYGPYLSFAALVTIVGWSRIFPVVERLFSLGPILFALAIFMSLALVVLLLLMRLLKVLLGIPLDWEEEWSTWSAADQHLYGAGERADDRQGDWRRRRWPGVSAGRGRAQYDRWRHGERP